MTVSTSERDLGMSHLTSCFKMFTEHFSSLLEMILPTLQDQSCLNIILHSAYISSAIALQFYIIIQIVKVQPAAKIHCFAKSLKFTYNFTIILHHCKVINFLSVKMRLCSLASFVAVKSIEHYLLKSRLLLKCWLNWPYSHRMRVKILRQKFIDIKFLKLMSTIFVQWRNSQSGEQV